LILFIDSIRVIDAGEMPSRIFTELNYEKSIFDNSLAGDLRDPDRGSGLFGIRSDKR